MKQSGQVRARRMHMIDFVAVLFVGQWCKVAVLFWRRSCGVLNA